MSKCGMVLVVGSILQGCVGTEPSGSNTQTFTVPKITKPYPRLFVDEQDLSVIKKRIENKEEPASGLWIRLNSAVDKELQAGFEAQPYVGTDQAAFYKACLRDASMARDFALAHKLSGNQAYADKALEILHDWIYADPMPAAEFDSVETYPNLGMLVARSMIQFVWTYDLLHDNLGFDSDFRAKTEEWFRVCEKWIKIGALRWEENGYFDKQYYQNHLCADAMALTAIGYALGDRELVQYALDSNENDRDFLNLIQGMVLMEGDEPYYREPEKKPVQTGEIIDRYRHYEIGGHYGGYVTKPNRGLQYCVLSMNLMNITAQMHYKNGINLFGYTASTGESLRLPSEFYSDFYRLKDASIKEGFYDGETYRMGEGGDYPTFFELPYSHYLDSDPLRAVLEGMDRAEAHRTNILGWPALLFGETLWKDET